VNMVRSPAAAVARADCRLRVIARHGVGYDSVDVPAMTKAGVIVTNTPTSMPRPVATIALTFILALSGKLMAKDRLTRSGRWHERMDNMGVGLTGKTLGVIGAGRIGKELLRMARVLDMRLIASDPNVEAIELGYLNTRKVSQDALLVEADFVAICCLLDETTRHLIGEREFAQMKPSAYFHQRRPRADRQRACADRRARVESDRRSGARRVRAGADRVRQSAARDGPRHRHAALAVLDRRVLSQHGDDRAHEHRGCGRRSKAAVRRQPGGVRAPALEKLLRLK